MHEATIGIATAQAKMDITATPSAVVPPNVSTVSSNVFTPSPVNEAILNPIGPSFFTTAADTPSTAIGGITFQQTVELQVGMQTNSLVPQLLNAFQYTFEDFTLSGTFEYGDLVYFNHSSNEYNAALNKADVNNTSKGAFNNLFVFISYIGTTLKVMHKGYLEIPDGKINNWSVGSTLYLNNNNILDIVPATGGGNWVRSLGFCIPNKENKKIIWFEPDSTYLKLV